jgi:hypothetical protein
MPWAPEWQVMLTALHTPPTAAARLTTAQALARPSFDWDGVATRACAHGVAPLLYGRLQGQGLVAPLPPRVLETLQSAYYRNAARNTLLFRVVREVLQACRRQGLGVIALKGAALAETAYPHRAARPMSDIDLLVRPEAVAAADEALSASGYRFVGHGRPRDYWRARHYHLTFRPPHEAVLDATIELHWAIERQSRLPGMDMEGLWQRAVPAIIAGVEAHVLAPEDQVLHLCLHLCRHAGSPAMDGGLSWRLRAFCDLAAVLDRAGPGLDWQALVQRARAWGVASYLYVPLALTQELLGAAIPAAALEALAPPGFDRRLLAWARDELLEDPGPLFPDLVRLWGGPTLAQRAAVVRKVLSPARLARSSAVPATAARRYGSYPRRLADLVRRYGPLLWRLARRDPGLTAQAERKAHLAAWLAPFAVRDHSM